MTTTARPIIMSAPMTRAILSGVKTQTRRVVKPQPSSRDDLVQPIFDPAIGWRFYGGPNLRCPYGEPAGRLWVRETWRPLGAFDDYTTAQLSKKFHEPHIALRDHLTYRATDDDGLKGWRPSIFMPRWASRITLRVTSVRVERLQEISEYDAFGEGVAHCFAGPQGQFSRHPIEAFRELWESINAVRAPWSSNPYVWVLEFERCQ